MVVQLAQNWADDSQLPSFPKNWADDADLPSIPRDLSMEELVARAKEAVGKLTRARQTLRTYFRSLDLESMGPYQRPRVASLITESSALFNIETKANYENRFDLIRIIRHSSRQTAWLVAIIAECESIVKGESSIYCRPVITV